MPLLQTIKVVLHNHALLLYGQFAPIQKEIKTEDENSTDKQNNQEVENNQNSINKKLHFTFPIAILLITSYLGTFHLPVEHEFTFNDFSTNPEVFSHQVVPRALWTNFDYALALTVFCTILILIYALSKTVAHAESKFMFNR